MKRNWKLPLAVVLTALCVGGIVWAGGETLMQGQDSSNISRYVLVDSAGRIVTTANASGGAGSAAGTHGACTVTALTVTNAAANCPPTPLAARSSLVIQNTQSGSTIYVRNDGSAATTTTGLALGNSDAYRDNIAGTVNASCICSTASCTALAIECP